MRTYVRHYDPDTDRDAVVTLQLKEQDAEEVIAATGMSVQEAMEEMVNDIATKGGEHFVIVHEDHVEGVLGCFPSEEDPDIALAYFLSTEAIYEFKYKFIKYSGAVIEMFLKKYKVLTNFTPKDYYESVEWLTAIGAQWDRNYYTLHDPDTCFKRFYFERSS